MMRIYLSAISLMLLLGCSQSRVDEFCMSFREHVKLLDKSYSSCQVNGQRLSDKLIHFAEDTPVSDVNMPFLCYIDIGMHRHQHLASDNILVRWNGIFDRKDLNRQYRQSLDFSFTVFMVTTNDSVQVLSFEKFRNGGRYGGMEGKHFNYYDGEMDLLIWDGIFPDRNHPGGLFREQYKDTIAVLTERPFNYCYYLTPDRLYAALDGFPRQKLYRVVNKTETNIIFVSEAVLSLNEPKNGNVGRE